MTAVNDIDQPGKGRLPEDKLAAYLEGRLSPEEQHEVELWLAEEGMESDAVDGLQQLSAEDTKNTVSSLNHYLHKQLSDKKRKRKRPLKDNQWAWMAVVIVLFLAILGYLVLHIAAK